MSKFTRKLLRNKKQIFYLLAFFLLSILLPVSAYFISSDRTFDERGRAWWDIDFDKDRPGWTDIDFDSDENSTTPSDPGGTAPVNGAVKITKFEIKPTSIKLGESATLSWTTINALRCRSIAKDPIRESDVPTSGTRTVTPGKEGQVHYTLLCDGADGSRDVIEKAITVGSASTPTPTPTPTLTPTPTPASACSSNADCRGESPYEVCFTPAGICLRGNVNNDGNIGMRDFNMFREDFISFKEKGWSIGLKRSDLNLDGAISMADYSIFVKSYRTVNYLD